jgi:hypothetical protein
MGVGSARAGAGVDSDCTSVSIDEDDECDKGDKGDKCRKDKVICGLQTCKFHCKHADNSIYMFKIIQEKIKGCDFNINLSRHKWIDVRDILITEKEKTNSYTFNPLMAYAEHHHLCHAKNRADVWFILLISDSGSYKWVNMKIIFAENRINADKYFEVIENEIGAKIKF